MTDDDWINHALDRPSRDQERFAKGKEIPLHPLIGWNTGTLDQNAVFLYVEVLTPPPEKSARILRVAMTRKKCRELAKALEQLAHIPHVLPAGKPS